MLVFMFGGKGSSVSSASAPHKLEHHLLFRLKRLWGETSIKDKDGGVGGGRRDGYQGAECFLFGIWYYLREEDRFSVHLETSPTRQDLWTRINSLKKLKHVNQCIFFKSCYFLVSIHFLFDVWRERLMTRLHSDRRWIFSYLISPNSIYSALMSEIANSGLSKQTMLS